MTNLRSAQRLKIAANLNGDENVRVVMAMLQVAGSAIFQARMLLWKL